MVVFEKPKALTENTLHYCPGCTHGIIHRLVAEALEERQQLVLHLGHISHLHNEGIDGANLVVDVEIELCVVECHDGCAVRQ